jgi:hypothetical protein
MYILHESHTSPDLTEYTCNDHIVVLGYRAFYNRRRLTAVNFTGPLRQMGTEAFMFCTSLVTMVIPDSVNIIGPNVFRGCTKLKRIVSPSHIDVYTSTFNTCPNLVDVVIKTTKPQRLPFIYPATNVIRIWTDTDVEVPNAVPFVIIGPGVPTLKLLHKWAFALHWHWNFPTKVTPGQYSKFIRVVYFTDLPPEQNQLIWTYIPMIIHSIY